MNRIKELRTRKKCTQKELADLLGVTSMTISRWEKEENPAIKHEQAQTLANHFRVSVPYLLGYIDEDSPFTNPKLEEVLTRFSEEPNKLREYAKTHDISDRIEEITESDELFSFYDNLDKVTIQIDGKESLSNSEKKAIERLRIELSTYIDMLYDIKLKLQSIEANSTPNTK